MISLEDAANTYEYSEFYKILPQINDWDKDTLNRIKNGHRVSTDFSYSSDKNTEWMKKSELEKWLIENSKNDSRGK